MVLNPVSEENLEAVLQRHASKGRGGLLPLLQEAQRLNGHLSKEVLTRIGQRLDIPLSEIYGVASFYPLLHTRPVGRRVVKVCDDLPCYLAGGERVIDALKKALKIELGETTQNKGFTLELTPCLGACHEAPAMLVSEELRTALTPKKALDLLKG